MELRLLKKTKDNQELDNEKYRGILILNMVFIFIAIGCLTAWFVLWVKMLYPIFENHIVSVPLK